MFHYRALFRTSPEEPPVGLMVVESSTGPLRAVMWNHRSNAWTFSPKTLARILYGDEYEERRQIVDRSRAEEIARTLGTELPSEEELHRICEEGVAAEPHPAYHGWTMQRPTGTWSYYTTPLAVGTDLPGPTLIAVEGTEFSTKAVVWDRNRKTWAYRPDRIAAFLYEERSWKEVDRSTAEEIARTNLGTELPSEEELHRICEEGETAARKTTL